MTRNTVFQIYDYLQKLQCKLNEVEIRFAIQYFILQLLPGMVTEITNFNSTSHNCHNSFHNAFYA